MLFLLLSCSITPCCFSDHEFVDLQINFSDDYAQGPGLWKFNSFLNDTDFCDFILAKIDD